MEDNISYDSLYFITINTNKTFESLVLNFVDVEAMSKGIEDYFKQFENNNEVPFLEGDYFLEFYELKDFAHEIGPKTNKFHWHLLVHVRHINKIKFRRNKLQDDLREILNIYLPYNLSYGINQFPHLNVKFKTFKTLESEIDKIQSYIDKNKNK